MEHQSRPVTGYPPTAYPQAHPSSNPNGFPNTTTATTGTAYPIATPPPPAAAAYYAPPLYQDPRATFLRRLLGIIIASVIAAGTIVLIIWLIFRPRLPQFRVDSVTLSNFNLSTSSSLISGNWDVRFTARNPNHKITVFYDRIDASVFYKARSISSTTLPPFVQGKRTETPLRATFVAAGTYVDQWVVEGIKLERSAESAVSFNVRMVARVRFKAGAWRARRRFLSVYCGELPVGVSANGSVGTMISGPRQCRVAL